MSFEQSAELLKQSDKFIVGKGATAAEIEQAQEAIGLKFPASYVRFLMTYGWAVLDNDRIYGLGEDLPYPFMNVAARTKDEREECQPNMAKHLIPLLNDGCGNHSCLDTRKTKNGDAPIVFWDHEARAGSRQKPAIKHKGFFDFLCERAERRLKGLRDRNS